MTYKCNCPRFASSAVGERGGGEEELRDLDRGAFCRAPSDRKTPIPSVTFSQLRTNSFCYPFEWLSEHQRYQVVRSSL